MNECVLKSCKYYQPNCRFYNPYIRNPYYICDKFYEEFCRIHDEQLAQEFEKRICKFIEIKR